MKTFWIILLLMVGLLFSGCGDKMALTPETLTALGLPETAEIFVDGFTARQISLHVMHTKNAKNYYDAVKISGITVTPKIEKVGDIVFVTQEVKYIPRPELISMPTKLDIHPVWQTTVQIAELTLFGYGIHEIAKMFSSADTGDTYNLQNSNVRGAFNDAGNNQTIDIMRDWAPITETTTW